jgi:concanavalin A-like lectin/glucanase superfamily protein
VRLYVDGVDVTNPASIPASVPAFPNTAEDLFIGRASNASAGFAGFVDEAAVYDRALSASEVAAHYAAR